MLLFEISRGCAEFSGAAELSPLLRYVGVAFALGFSGVSVACQISERTGEISLSILPYLAKNSFRTRYGGKRRHFRDFCAMKFT